MRPTPYVGVASLATVEQVERVTDMWPMDSGWALNVGIQVSDKTQAGLPVSDKWRPRMPNIEMLEVLIRWHDNCINIIHLNTDHPETHWRQLIHLIREAGLYLDGFQLNMPKHCPWPEWKQLDVYGGVVPGRRMILQLGPAALESVGGDAKLLVDRLVRYNGIITDVMFDLSLGQGLSMNTEVLKPYLLAVREKLPKLGLTVAGGLGPERLESWKKLRKEIPDLSCDAESQLRDTHNQLDLGLVKGYLDEVRIEISQEE